MSSSKLVAGLFIGAASGLILGILFAPDKGTETRRKISEKAGNIIDELKEAFKDMAGGRPSGLSRIKLKGSMLESEVDSEWSN